MLRRAAAAAAFLGSVGISVPSGGDSQTWIRAPFPPSAQAARLGVEAGEPSAQKLYVFLGKIDGEQPVAPLLRVGSVFYGTVKQGGGNGDGEGCLQTGCGAVFQIAPGPANGAPWIESIVYGFGGSSHNDGRWPEAGVIRDRAGALYGTTPGGGGGPSCENLGCGTVFKLTPHGSGYSERVLYVFQDEEDGAVPEAGLVADRSGALYGTTSLGGYPGCFENSGCGTVFKLTPTRTGYAESTLYDFQGGSDGENPTAGLIIGKNGVLYGVAAGGSGCSTGCGVAFTLTPSKAGYVERVIYAFKGGSGADGPSATLVADRHGNLYGTTSGGGATSCGVMTGCGTVFELSPSGAGYVERVLYRFTSSGSNDGYFPLSSVLLGRSGVIYGTTLSGGAGNYQGYGTVFTLRPVGSGYAESVIKAFTYYAEGAWPYAGVIEDASGALYGTTEEGGGGPGCPGHGGAGCGTVFRILP